MNCCRAGRACRAVASAKADPAALQLFDCVAGSFQLCNESLVADQVTSSDDNEIVVAFLREMLDLGQPSGIAPNKQGLMFPRVHL